MRRTATITQTKTRGYTIRARGNFRQGSLADALETLALLGWNWARFRPLVGVSKLLTIDERESLRFAAEFDLTALGVHNSNQGGGQ